MTAQIDDMFRYKRRNFSVSGISEGELFNPSLLDLHPAGRCSACWRGYQAIYDLSESRLVLDTLYINLSSEGEGNEHPIGPTINGVKPEGPRKKHDWFNTHYHHLEYHLEYSGGLLLADGFMRKLYVHMGFQRAWKYKRVLELVFENGILKQEFDRSKQMAEVRRQILESSKQSNERGMPSQDEMRDMVTQSFDRSY